MLIVFKDEIGSEVEYIEIEKGAAIFNEIDLLKTQYETLEKQFEHMDANLEIEDGGFNAPKFGLGVYRALKSGKYGTYPKRIIVYSRQYFNNETPSADDIIKLLLG